MGPPVLHLHIRAFARYAELLGGDRFSLELPGPATVSDALQQFRTQVPGADQLPVRPLVAVDLKHVLPDHVLADGDELALMPPLAGG